MQLKKSYYIATNICSIKSANPPKGWGQVKRTMMTSSNGNIFREITGQQRIPLTNASDAELWYAPELTVE